MRRSFLLVLFFALGMAEAQARDGALLLEWSTPVPAGAEAVVTMRSATGELALSLRNDLAEGAVAQRLDLPPLPRTAQSIQAGVVHEGQVILQGTVMPVAGNVGLDIETPLSDTLAVGFTNVWDCGDPRPYQTLHHETGVTLIRDYAQHEFAADPERPDHVLADDGSTLTFTGNRARFSLADRADLDCAAALFPPLLPLTAIAQDRSWTVGLTRDEAVVTLPGLDNATLAARGVTISAPRDGAIHLRSDTMRLELTQARCRLREADLIYPITARLSGQSAQIATSGCAGDPRDLLGGGAWQVTSLLGQALDRDRLRELTLEISGDAISGRGTCNRYVGTASVEGGALAFRDLGTTRLDCPTDMRNMELRFLDALEAVTGFDISRAGMLTLRAGAQTILTARRRPTP